MKARIEHLEMRAQRLEFENAILRHHVAGRPPPAAASSEPSLAASRRASITSEISEPIGVPSREEKAREKVDEPEFERLRTRAEVSRAVTASMVALRSNPYAPWTTVMTEGRGLQVVTPVPATGALPDLPTYPATPPEWASSDDD